MIFPDFSLDTQHGKSSVENKRACIVSLLVCLGKALTGISSSLCCRKMVGPSCLFVVVAQSSFEGGWC